MQVLTDSYTGMNGFLAVEVDELFMVGGGSSSISFSLPGGGYGTYSTDGNTYTANTYNSLGMPTSSAGGLVSENTGTTLTTSYNNGGIVTTFFVSQGGVVTYSSQR